MTSDARLYRRLLAQARPYGWMIGLSLVLSLLATPLALLTPLPLKLAVDSVVGSIPPPGFLAWAVPRAADGGYSGAAVLWLAVGLTVVLAASIQLQSMGASLLKTWVGHRMVLDFRSRMFRHAQRLSLAYHDSKGTSDTTYRILYDGPSIRHVAVEGLIPLVTATVTLAAMLAVTAGLNLRLALVALAVSPLLIGSAHFYRRRLRNRWIQVKKIESEALSVVQEALGAMRVVKAFGREDYEQDRFVNRSTEGIGAYLRVMLAEGAFSLVVGLTIATGTALVLLVGVRDVQRGMMTLGELLLVMAYLAQLYGPLKTVGTHVATLQGALASADRAFALLGEAPDVPERPGARPIARARGEVEFDRVWFGYEAGQPVLRDASFRVSPGTSVGISGRTGTGKTTLICLLTRFYDPMSGAVRLDGVDVRDFKLRDLRNQFSLVLQDSVLFSASIAENIAYARPDASAEEIEAAARSANIHDFIVGLPEGYRTPVGERGMRLSGGERQRLSLARAFLKDAPVLVLDEPTSSVDVTTESDIMETMQRLMRGRTTIMIAHRLSTLAHCDVRIEIADGHCRVLAPGDGTGGGARNAAGCGRFAVDQKEGAHARRG